MTADIYCLEERVPSRPIFWDGTKAIPPALLQQSAKWIRKISLRVGSSIGRAAPKALGGWLRFQSQTAKTKFSGLVAQW
jgi:hypothetical protein